jgi:L-iditol 2-dehydrogenase
MRALLQHGINDLRLADLPRPTPKPGEVVIRIHAATICASDLHIYSEGNVGGVSWEAPFVPGHEAAGVVADPNGSDFAPGTPVVFDPAIPCRACENCAAGRAHVCRNLLFCDLPPTHGAMQEYLAWPATQVFALPETMDLVVAPLFEPLCVAVHATRLCPDLTGATVFVAGCGGVGLLTALMAKVRGAKQVYAADPIPERLALARQLGIETVAMDAWPQDVDVVFEAAGPQEALLRCLEIARPAGTVIVIGIPSEDSYSVRPSLLRRKELTLCFAHRQNENYPEAISLVKEGKIQLEPLLTHRFPIERAQEAFDLAQRKTEGAVRVAVTFD